MHGPTATIRPGDVLLHPVPIADLRHATGDVVVGFTDGTAWTFVGRRSDGNWWHSLRQRHVDAALRAYAEENRVFAKRVAEALTRTGLTLVRNHGENPEIPAFVVTEPAAASMTTTIPVLHSAASSAGPVDDMLRLVVRNLVTPLPKLHAFVVEESVAAHPHRLV